MSEPVIDVKSLIQPLLIKAVLRGEEIPIDVIIDAEITQKIYDSLMKSIQLPPEYADLKNVIDLMMQMDSVKRVLAVVRGQAPPEPAIDKVIELVVNLQLLSTLAGAFGGGEEAGTETGTETGTKTGT